MTQKYNRQKKKEGASRRIVICVATGGAFADAGEAVTARCCVTTLFFPFPIIESSCC